MAKETNTPTLQKGYRLQSKERTYEILKVLGSGSFGITYLAIAKVAIGNISTTVRFAIKEHFMSASCYRGDDGATVLTVPTAKSDVVDSRRDFITEANRLKNLCLKSRNIVSVNETFEANGTAYYIMEYLDGGNPSKCSEEEAISIVRQIGEALNEIHKEHMLHLDLKPDNIVLKTNDKGETYPVLIDFGISKHFDSKGRPTSSLSAKGASPGYAPQEQYAGVSEFSPKYDIYALGAVLFYLCTGKNPPDAFKISPNQQELKKELLGKVSSNVEKAILNAMKPSAMERTPSIKQFCADLMGGANEIPQDIEETKNGPGTVVLPKGSTWWKRNGKKVYVASGVVLAASILGGFLLNNKRDTKLSDNEIKYNLTDSISLERDSKLLEKDNLSISEQEIKPEAAAETYDEKLISSQGEPPIPKIESRESSNDALSKVEPPSPSNDDLFAKATTLEDFRSLANKGYKKAYAPLAEQYLKKHQYESAHQWAVKAGNAKVGLDQARKVVEVLNSYGFYDNGEHGGKPNF